MSFIRNTIFQQNKPLLIRCRVLLFCIFLVLLPGVRPSYPAENPTLEKAITVAPVFLNFSGPLNDQNAEVSGLTWNGDSLVVLPQDPAKFGDGGFLGFFSMGADQLRLAIADERGNTITPRLVKCYAPGLSGVIRGFDGLEALGIIEGRCFITVEAGGDSTMAGYLLCGDYDATNEVVYMDMNRLTSIPLSVNIPNIAEESIIIDGNRVITFSEANGKEVCADPRAKVFDRDVNYLEAIPFPNIEYRVTDATALDENGCFWVINFSYPPESQKLKVAPDCELEKYGPPTDGNDCDCVERLLELQLTEDNQIVRTETPPIYLTRRTDGRCRNWEGLVRFDEGGFLLMTDRYPGTLLAYVPNPFFKAK